MFLKVSYARRNKFCVQKVPKLNILQSSGPRLFKLLCDACPFVGFAFFPIYHEVCNYFLFHDPMEHKSPTSNFLTGKKNFCVYLLQNKRVLNTVRSLFRGKIGMIFKVSLSN